MKKLLISIIVLAMLCASFLTVGLVAQAETLEDTNLGFVDVTQEPAENPALSDIKGTSVGDKDSAESARRIMGPGDSFIVNATFGPHELNKYAYLRVETEGNRHIEISTDNGTTWTTIGSKELAGSYGASIMGEDHRGTEDSQVTFYDISKFVPVSTGAKVKIRFSTPAGAERNGCIFKNFKIFRAPTFDFSDGNMTEVVDVKAEADFFDLHRAKIENEGPKADGWGFYMWRVLVPAGATDAHMIANIGFGNRGISVIKENGTSETHIGYKDHENGKEGALLKTDIHPEWGEGNLHYSLKDFLNTDGTATPLIIKMRPHNLGQQDGPMTKALQFSYTTAKETSTIMPNAGVEDVVNVFEHKKDNKTDSPYWVSDDGQLNEPETNVFYDNDKTGVYKIPYEAGLERAVLRANVRGYYKLSVSTDNATWKDVAIGDLETADGNGPRQSDIFVDVTEYVDTTKAGELYVRIADNSPRNGYGPKWEKLGLDCNYGDATLTFTGDTINVDISDDMQIQDRLGAPYTEDGAHRFADGSYYFTYAVEAPAGTEHLHMQAKIGGGNRKVEVSTDNGATWTAIDDAKQDIAADEVKSEGSFYNLAGLLNTSGATKILVRFGCNDAGSGSDLNALSFVRGQDFSEIVSGGATVEFDQNEKTAVVHVKDESKMWEVNGTASQETGFGGGWHRFADGTSFFTYKVEFPSAAKENVFLKADVQGSNRHIEVSKDGKNWIDLSYVGINDNDPLYGADLIDGRFSIFRLDKYLTDTSTLFVKFSSKNEGQGNGADVYSNVYFMTDAQVVNGDGVLTLDKNMVQNVNLSDKTLLADDSGSEFGRNGDSIYRKADGENSFTYKLKFPSNTEYAYSMIRMQDTANRYIEISSDGVTFKPLSYKGMDEVDGASYKNGDRYFFSFDQAFRASADGSVWLRFGAKDGTGEGAKINEMIVFYNKPFNETVTYPENAVVADQTMIAGPGEEGFYQPELSVGSHDGNFDGDGFRFYDNATYGVYKFTYEGNPSILKLVLEVRGGYRVSVSADGKDWTDVLVAGIDYAPEGAPLQNRAYHDINITSFLNEAKTIYVKVGDSTDWHGWGGAISRATLLAVSGGDEIVKKPVFADGELSKSVKLQDGSYLYDQSGSTFEYTGRGVKGADAYFTYKFELPSDATSFFVAFNNKNAIKMDVSADGTNFQDIPDSALLNSEVGKGSAVTYNLGYFLATSKTVYVRFTDGNASDDLGAILLSLYAGYNTESLSSAGKIYANESHDTFIVGTEEEKEHIHVMDTENIENRWEYRSIKKNAQAIYKFAYEDGLTALKLRVSVGGTFKISVSKDGVNFVDRLVSTSQYYAQSGREEDCFYATVDEYVIDISDIMTDNADKSVYVKVSDPIDDNDFGAQLVGLGLIGMSGDEVVAPVEKNGCNSTLNSGMMAAALALLACGAVLLAKKAKKD